MNDFIDGKRIVADAWNAFDRWCLKHDPEGDMDIVDRIEAYGKWCDDQKRIADIPVSFTSGFSK